MRRVLARVTLSELASQVNAYPPWELPILELVHGGQVRIVGYARDDAPVPLPENEYLRLERRYGEVKGTGQSRVSQAYGEGQLGIQRLADAMREDLAEQAELDALPEDERELRRLEQERERVERDIASLERRRRADGSGPAAYRAPLGRARVEEIRRLEEAQRRGENVDELLAREQTLKAREAELAERERAFAERQAQNEAPATPPERGPEKEAEDAADIAQPGRGRKRA